MTGFLESRATSHRSGLVRKLFRIIIDKKSNLCASLDVDTADELLKLADQVGPYVCMIKTHCDATINFTMDTVAQLKRLAEKHEFLIFEDRKFADIGNTVKNQYQHGPFQIVQWADLTNCHGVFGPGIIKGLKEAAATVDQPRGLLMLAELSAKDNLAHGEYTNGCIKIAETDPDFCIGFIAQRGVPSEHEWVVLTPGVGLDDKGDNLGQQYRTVDDAVSSGSDVIIVGRGLFGKGRDPVEQAERYRNAGWEALLKRE